VSAAVVAAVTVVHTELYDALEAGDVDRLAAVWDDGDDLVCIHPGWPAVAGRAAVLRSYAVILANTAYLQFFPTGVEVRVDDTGAVAVVTASHSLITRAGEGDEGLGETARVVSTSVFRRRPDGWRLWTHHGSPVLGDDPDGGPDDADGGDSA
jgi:ketosteroid isomerase-like protein